MNQNQKSVSQQNSWQDKLIIVFMGALQGIILWLALEKGFSHVLRALDPGSTFEAFDAFNPFTFPLATVVIVPFLFYLNWDFWRTSARSSLLVMALGLTAFLLCFDAYGVWLEVESYNLFEERIFPAALALFVLLPFFRARLMWVKGQREAAYSAVPGAKVVADDESQSLQQVSFFTAWLPSGQAYAREFLRAGSLLFVALITCLICLGLLALFFEIVGGLFNVLEDYSILPDLSEIFEVELFLYLFSMIFSGLLLSYLIKFPFLPILVKWLHRVAAWSFAPLSILIFLVFVAVPLNFILGTSVMPSDGKEIIALEIFILIGLMFAATLRDYGPFAGQVWGKIARIATVLNVLICLAMLPFFIDTFDVSYASYLEKSDIFRLELFIPVVPMAFFFAVAVIARHLYGWTSRWLPFMGISISLFVLLVYSPVLSPSRIAAASYASYLVSKDNSETDSNEADDRNKFNRLYNYYDKYGPIELERLAKFEGNGEKAMRIRELAALALELQGGTDNSGPFTIEQRKKLIASISVWPQGRALPEQLLSMIPTTAYTFNDLKSEVACNQIFIMDFNKDGLDDALFLDLSQNTWTLWTAEECITIPDFEGSICGASLANYDEEMKKRKSSGVEVQIPVTERKTGWQYHSSGSINNSNESFDDAKMCEDIKNSLLQGNVSLVDPIPSVFDLKVGDLRIGVGK